MPSDAVAEPDGWRPAATWSVLELRAALLATVRGFFARYGFLEVETPLLSADVVVDRHLDPFATLWVPEPTRPDQGRRLWLQTSPEFAMKRLLAAGPRAIYQVTRAFRNGEVGPRHNPEFTIVEWYRPGDDYAHGMRLLGDLAQELFAPFAVFPPTAAGQPSTCELLSYGEAFRELVGLDPLRASPAQLAEQARRHALAIPPGLDPRDRDGWLDLLLVERVEPHLGQRAPTILYDYPASQAALAQLHGDPPVAARFELYARGIELANGYLELLDADELRARQGRANALRRSDGKPALPEESRLLDAMQAGLPRCVGCALGLDRVVMLAAGCRTLAEVLAFPIERA